MDSFDCSLLTADTDVDNTPLTMDDYSSAVARWCPGCGDHAVLSAVQKLLESEQLRREEVVICSGIGCSSRFPHYMKTYGFHGLHGRALPVATGVKMTRPDLKVFTIMGDGDCTSIGLSHWIHSVRYNVDMVAILLDNSIYALTKNQTSPTSPQGLKSNTQQQGSYLPPMNALSAALGITNCSFAARTADWTPGHLFETLHAAYHHKGFSFVHILQRCPVFTSQLYHEAARKLDLTEILTHPKGIVDPDTESLYKAQLEHDPSNLTEARRLAVEGDKFRIGLFYRDTTKPVYNETRVLPRYTAEEKMDILNAELDRYAV